MDVSVVIPTYARPDALARVLDAWEHQEPRDLAFEVIVVDDGSPDPSTLDTLASRRPRRYPLRVFTQANAGPAAARNRALEAARGAYVLITGDDIEPAPDLLAQHLAGHREQASRGGDATAIVGLTQWPPGETLTATMRHIDGVGAQQFSYHYFRDGAEYDFRHFYTSNISLRREHLEAETTAAAGGAERGARLGPFSTDFPAAAFEDAELGHRLAYRGLRIVYRQSAVAWHHHPYGARAFYRRQVRCGAMAALLFAKSPELAKWLGTAELQDRRIDLLASPDADRRRVERLAHDLPRWIERVVRIAECLDPVDPSGVDPLLHALFRFGVLDGLAHARLSEPAARRVLASWYLELFPPAVAGLTEPLARRGLDLARADREQVAALASA